MGKTKMPQKKNNKSLSLPSDITKKDKIKRGKYLSKRIDDLFDNISDWIKDLHDYKLKRSTIAIDDVKLPLAEVLLHNKLVVTLRPIGLWAFGVNCQVDIITEKEKYIIFDIAKESQPPDWQLISSKPGKNAKELTKIIFRNLLRKITRK